LTLRVTAFLILPGGTSPGGPFGRRSRRVEPGNFDMGPFFKRLQGSTGTRGLAFGTLRQLVETQLPARVRRMAEMKGRKLRTTSRTCVQPRAFWNALFEIDHCGRPPLTGTAAGKSSFGGGTAAARRVLAPWPSGGFEPHVSNAKRGGRAWTIWIPGGPRVFPGCVEWGILGFFFPLSKNTGGERAALIHFPGYSGVGVKAHTVDRVDESRPQGPRGQPGRDGTRNVGNQNWPWEGPSLDSNRDLLTFSGWSFIGVGARNFSSRSIWGRAFGRRIVRQGSRMISPHRP